jgi:hyperosmotically inducible periplasmic protein
MNMMNLKKLTAAALVCAAVATSACAASGSERSTGTVIDDGVIGAKVKTALIEDPVTKAHQIDVSVNKGVVQLAGTVDTQASKTQAGMLAQKVDGVHQVKNSLMVGVANRTTGQVVDDASVTARVKSALTANTITKAREINVDTSKGVVELHGFVDSQQEANEAVKEARAVAGVSSVKNNLQVKASN